MSRKAREMAEEMARRHLQAGGLVSKAVGAAGFDGLVDMYLPPAEAVVTVEKAARRVVRRQEALLVREWELAAQREEVLAHHRELLPRAEALAGQLQPSLPQPRGFGDLTEFELETQLRPKVAGMVEREMRRQMNGFGHVNGSEGELHA
jgi:hypothetical protein